MAELMVSASTGVMNSVLCKLATLMGDEFAKLKKLRKEVKFIKDELTAMKDALEGLSYLDELDPQTRRWRDIVREMSYDIEDIVDDFMNNIGESNKNIGFVSNTVGRLRTLRSRHKIAGQIEEIKALVIETSARRQRYKLDIPQYKPDTPLSSNVVIDPRVSTLYENAANLIGVEATTNEIENLLDDDDKKLKIVAIVGFGGLGKTTVANVVHGKLKGTFNQSAFVPVSQKPDIPKLLRSLLSQLGNPTSEDCELNVLDKLRERLHNNRYLIVIDDLWDMQAWNVIKCAFPENNLGSRVIVTTRIQNVAKACCLHGSGHVLEIKPLSSKDSRRLFLDRIFGSEEACPSELRDVTHEILKRCGGLPLAIISISSMLASECSNQKERWEHVRDSMGSASDLTLERVRQILNLSYKDLPSHLRTCFLYLGMYPEDFKIGRSNLERQWMAEGFISVENGQDVDEVAKSYFNELVNRSLIQPVDFDNKGLVASCRVHDMMLDLILVKAAEENFFTILDDPQSIAGLGYKVRRLSIRMEFHDWRDGTTSFPMNLMSHVRSVMIFSNCRHHDSILPEFKYLRVFFSPDFIVDLDWLCKSYNLRYFHSPEGIIGKMTLNSGVHKHLETLCVHYKIYLPKGIGNFKSLRYLSGFDFIEDTVDNIKGLGELANLRHLVAVQSDAWVDPNMKSRTDALRSSLGRLTGLKELLLVGNGRDDIDDLFPPSPLPAPYHLRTLILVGECYFSRVPSWMGGLRYLFELKCTVRELLNDGVGILAELPLLTYLALNGSRGEEGKIVFPGKGFPALKHFIFDLRVPYLTFQPGSMPKLQSLVLNTFVSAFEQNVVAILGMEHLLALEKVFVAMYVEGSDSTSIESTLRSAISMHPGNPHFKFSTYKLLPQ